MNEVKPDWLQNGVHTDPERPHKEAPGTSLGVQTGPAEGESSEEQKEKVVGKANVAELDPALAGSLYSDNPKPSKVREPYELQEQAWKLMDEAVRTGAMKLEDGTEVKLNADSLIRVIQWLASAKAKKPHLINPPEDFRLKETTSEKENT